MGTRAKGRRSRRRGGDDEEQQRMSSSITQNLTRFHTRGRVGMPALASLLSKAEEAKRRVSIENTQCKKQAAVSSLLFDSGLAEIDVASWKSKRLASNKRLFKVRTATSLCPSFIFLPIDQISFAAES